MASALHRLAGNFRAVIFKAAGLRLSDVDSRDTAAYAEIITGDGPPAGAYGRAAGVSMMYLQQDADGSGVVTWTTCDGGVTWAQAHRSSLERYTLDWLAGARGKPGLNADINSATEAVREIADPDFELLGTNAVSACATYATDGGITLTTTTGSGDQVILVPHLDANQSAWGTVLWPTGKSLIWEGIFDAPATITSMIAWLGLKLTNTSVVATDNDQILIRYEAGVNSGKIEVITSIAGTDTTTDSGITFTASARYHVRVVLTSARVAKIYINGTLIYTTAALTSVGLIPYIGVQTSTTAARAVTVRRQSISRLF